MTFPAKVTAFLKTFYGELFPNTYSMDIKEFSAEEIHRFKQHTLSFTPVWSIVFLHVLTFGVFSFLHFSGMHTRFPKVCRTDPDHSVWGLWLAFRSPIGIPKLCDRINFQLKLRGDTKRVYKSLFWGWNCLLLAWGVLAFVNPYPLVTFILIAVVLGLVFFCHVQLRINRLVELER